MSNSDLILLHPPSIYDFREKPIMYGPISDVVPSTPIFEMYPLGFMTIAQYLKKHGYSVRIINVAVKMLRDKKFDVEKLIRDLNPLAFGIDLHWLVHAHGSLELAKVVKKYHPRTPVIFGGLSASYYYEELINCSQVDYVIRGGSAEKPLSQLLEVIEQRASPTKVPNLIWENDGKVTVNELTYLPTNLNTLSFNYGSMVRSSLHYKDLGGHLPFQNWLDYPIVALLPWRGCTHNCITCGGSAQAYQQICGRESPANRSPGLLAKDVASISQYFNGPIIILGDIRSAGSDYAARFFSEIRKKEVKNHIALELFQPASKDYLEMINDSIHNFNLQISPESHDEGIRKAFGRNYSNKNLYETIRNALELGCKRIDLFFMIGLPKQTPRSVEETISYCEFLLSRFSDKEEVPIHPYISPLAPFLDPGSKAFEDPDQYGYKLFHRTLTEHKQALLAPSWKYTLNYETEWMTRGELVTSTYQASSELNRVKGKYRLITENEAKKIQSRIRQSLDLTEKIDSIMENRDQPLGDKEREALQEEFLETSSEILCNNKEMRWFVGLKKFNLLKIFQLAVKGVLDRFKR